MALISAAVISYNHTIMSNSHFPLPTFPFYERAFRALPDVCQVEDPGYARGKCSVNQEVRLRISRSQGNVDSPSLP